MISLYYPTLLSSKKMPEPRRAAISTVVKDWNLHAVATPLEPQFKAGRKAGAQLPDRVQGWEGQVKAIIDVCDDQVKAAARSLTDRVNEFTKTFTEVIGILELHRCPEPGKHAVIPISFSLLKEQFEAVLEKSDATFLALEARLRAVTKEWRSREELIPHDLLKTQLQYDRDRAEREALDIHRKAVKQIEEVQSEVGGQYMDVLALYVSKTLTDPTAQLHGIYFIKTRLLPTVSEDTKKAFFAKNDEAKQFFMFLAFYLHAVGSLKETILPLFFTYKFRKELQSLRKEYSTADLSTFQTFLTDLRAFNALKDSFNDNPLFEKLRKLSIDMVEEEVPGTFMECCRAVVAFPSPNLNAKKTYEAYQDYKKEEEEEMAKDCDLLDFVMV